MNASTHALAGVELTGGSSRDRMHVANGTSRHSLRRNIFGRYRMHSGQTLVRVLVHLAPFRPRFRATMPVDLAPLPQQRRIILKAAPTRS